MLDLVLPRECGGCGMLSTRWCDACARELGLRPDDPRLITPRVDPSVPVFSLGRYAGARRAAIVAAKERGRSDLIAPLSAALGAGLDRLVCWGIADLPLTLVPAPTRGSAARRRGGDPVTRIAKAVNRDGVGVVSALRMRAMTRDSVGLTTAARQRNVRGRVKLRSANRRQPPARRRHRHHRRHGNRVRPDPASCRRARRRGAGHRARLTPRAISPRQTSVKNRQQVCQMGGTGW